ncbi:hypothetical protein P171DRAFT_493363 [Karstenula rhodostoma CBS 690.94]|uniref:Uncharacterized protein n=1 Tax=Karstenula rhodostoma CBS 690.94 TaxID=1392251 RepID=A0A9P4PX06_9PLEO|nr:hypothetical protein P171DRAFT_493363 [Karstenula rhodostoma CBS 690.94]
MLLSRPVLALAGLLSSTALAAPQYLETVYLVNCGNSFSEMDYYAEGHSSFDGSWPNDQCRMSGSGTTWWEGVARSCNFGSTTFTSHIDSDASSKPAHSIVGWGKNKYHEYSCRKEDNYRLLYTKNGAECRSIYYCTWQV